MEVRLAKCDKCFEENLPEEFNDLHKPKNSGGFNFSGGKYTYIENPELAIWRDGRKNIWDSLPEVLCVCSDDDFNTSICLDHLGLQLKVNK